MGSRILVYCQNFGWNLGHESISLTYYSIPALPVDYTEIRQVKKDDLCRELGLVLLDTYLFATTVMENIRYGRLDATDEDVIKAARMAKADHFIRKLPQEYQTNLSERAVNISQG